MDPRTARYPLRLSLLAVAGALALGVAGCEQPGTAEQMGADAGRTLDRAADTAGKAANRAGEAAREQVADAAKTLDDTSLTARVKSKLIAEAGPAGLAIDVSSTKGVVTLEGTVDAPELRERAARAASGVDGVKSVDNRLVVARGS